MFLVINFIFHWKLHKICYYKPTKSARTFTLHENGKSFYCICITKYLIIFAIISILFYIIIYLDNVSPSAILILFFFKPLFLKRKYLVCPNAVKVPSKVQWRRNSKFKPLDTWNNSKSANNPMKVTWNTEYVGGPNHNAFKAKIPHPSIT